MHEARKTQLMHHALTSRKEKSESQEKAFAEKFQRRFADMAKREHEDHLKHFQVQAIIIEYLCTFWLHIIQYIVIKYEVWRYLPLYRSAIYWMFTLIGTCNNTCWLSAGVDILCCEEYFVISIYVFARSFTHTALPCL